MVTESGEEHGMINVLANSCKDNGFAHMEPEWKAKAEKMKKDDNKKIKARYLNKNGDHERLTRPYCRWAGDPIQIWHFIPGYEYEVPKGLVDEVNNTRLAERGGLVGILKDGKETAKVRDKDGKGSQIHQFVPVSF